MRLLDGDEADDGDIVFRDFIMLTLSGFITLTVLMLAHIGTPAAKHVAADTAAPGNVLIEINWPNPLDADVDLWVQAPGDVPVGYSNKGGAIFNLLRDDLGHQLDASGANYEVSYSRGLVPGEYTVNAHLYRNRSAEAAVPVTVVASVKQGPQAMTRQLLATQASIGREGEELTVFRFKLDDEGALVPGSVNSLPRPLRHGVKS